jgi:hypothetical protein
LKVQEILKFGKKKKEFEEFLAISGRFNKKKKLF